MLVRSLFLGLQKDFGMPRCEGNEFVSRIAPCIVITVVAAVEAPRQNCHRGTRFISLGRSSLHKQTRLNSSFFVLHPRSITFHAAFIPQLSFPTRAAVFFLFSHVQAQTDVLPPPFSRLRRRSIVYWPFFRLSLCT